MAGFRGRDSGRELGCSGHEELRVHGVSSGLRNADRRVPALVHRLWSDDHEHPTEFFAQTTNSVRRAVPALPELFWGVVLFEGGLHDKHLKVSTNEIAILRVFL